MRAGKKINVHSSVKVMAMVSSKPMLAVPGCADRAIDPNEPMVVSALNKMARGVDDLICGAAVSDIRVRETR